MAPLVLMSMVRMMSLSVCSAKVLLLVMMPALLMRMSTSAAVAALAASMDSGEEISARKPLMGPFGESSWTVAAMAASLMSQIRTCAAPFSRQRRAMIFPIPEQPPVMSTVFP